MKPAKIFGVKIPLRSFYNMLVDDFDDYMREQHSARRAFHCILEAYHLREWVWHGHIENNQAVKDELKITNEAEFNALVNRTFNRCRTMRR